MAAGQWQTAVDAAPLAPEAYRERAGRAGALGYVPTLLAQSQEQQRLLLAQFEADLSRELAGRAPLADGGALLSDDRIIIPLPRERPQDDLDLDLDVAASLHLPGTADGVHTGFRGEEGPAVAAAAGARLVPAPAPDRISPISREAELPEPQHAANGLTPHRTAVEAFALEEGFDYDNITLTPRF